LAGILASAFALGPAIAQTGTPKPPPAASAPAPGAAAPASQSPDWLRGRWAVGSCAQDFRIEFGADYLAAVRSDRMIGQVEAAYGVVGDVIVMIAGRVLIADNENPRPGDVLVLRRVGDRLKVIGIDESEHPDREHRPQFVLRCP
jgi:hypothetical protein